ncbi:response regulator transcription factor [Amycolatopsis anabasis]|uniref:response regulator transcription factor n=1 Tax=Amycolatopsis anabasis TaxID=1840409 RepID=UPI00131DDC6D|nr:response regulator transcription factor [Amycolatopsis anabasis]
MRVLVLEDDADLRRAVTRSLRGDGLAVDAVADLAAADEALAVNDYDCAVLDRKVPGGDALHYVRERQSRGWTLPVLFLTALDDQGDVVAGLAHGDYLVKPFKMAELVARVRSLSRWSAAPARLPVLRCGDLELDTARHEVRRAGALLTLTRTEFAVLELLATHQGRVVSREALLRHGWDDPPSADSLNFVIGRLRKKLRDPPMIATERGSGYRLHSA